MNPQAERIVKEALSLRASHPDVPAIETLDLVMVGHHGSDMDFEDPAAPGGDHTHPTAPFGRLLRDAFARHISVEVADLNPQSQSNYWLMWEQGVMEPFAARYALWNADAGDEDWIREFASRMLERWPDANAGEASAIARRRLAPPSWRPFSAATAADLHVREAEEAGDIAREHSAFELAIHIEGASAVDQARAIAAAEAVFAAAGITPAMGARGRFERERSEIVGAADSAAPALAELEAANVWDEADSAAAKACCLNWPMSVEHAGLELSWRDAANRGQVSLF